MKNKNLISASLRLCGLILAACIAAAAQTKDFTQWVNPFIGTGGHGHTFPGATMPFGMVQLSPDTRIDNWDGSSGYHYSDDIIYGFSHTHLSGTGIPDGCDILFMPTVGESQFFAKEGDKTVNGYASKFSHANEKAEPGYYSVMLDDDGILAEMTATKRVGFHRYTFPKTDKANIILDLEWRDKLLDSDLKIVESNVAIGSRYGKPDEKDKVVHFTRTSGKRIEGYRRSSSWAKDQTVYFVAEFSEPFRSAMLDPRAMEISRAITATPKDPLSFIFQFDRSLTSNPILVKVAISYVSIEGARKNLEAELPGWDFDKVRADARAAWNKELSKIEVSGGTDEQTTNFYTALYHTAIQPNIFNDVDGRYKGHDGKVHQLPEYVNRRDAESQRENKTEDLKSSASQRLSGDGSDQYTVFSLWDTFRAAHPLYTIIDQKRTVDFINTFIRQYEQGGRLPVWELWGEETDTMIGYHAVPVIADAMAKGIKGFDYEKAYAAAKHSAELDHFGLAAYKKRGYISSEDENESVSKTLEYAYDDWCIAQMANILRERARLKEDELQQANPRDPLHWPPVRQFVGDYLKFSRRAHSFENLFDPSTGFMRPKRNGGFIRPFKPNEVTFNFTEGNSWVYSFFVPHDIPRLIELHGGPEKFAAKLDELFTTTDKLTGREQPDITGLIGQYAHGNEPSHHIAYLYNYAGQPWKTQMYVRKILNEFYKNSPDGLIGNEDCGQMSAWYILSALGFYEVNPARPLYDLGTPLFKEAKIHLENGKTFTIKAPNVSAANKYIASVSLNGKPHRALTFAHHELMNGGTLEFVMTDKPVKDWFDGPSVSEVGVPTTAVPIIEGERVFTDKTTIDIKAPLGGMVYWMQDGKTVSRDWGTEFHPFEINETTSISAYAIEAKQGNKSAVVTATFYKRPNDWSVKILSPYSSQYTGGSDDAIIDGLRGNVNFASGEWQGYQGKTFEAVIDLKRETEISNVGGSFLQSAGSWIWMPARLEFEISSDGVNFTKVADFKTEFPQTEMKGATKEFSVSIKPVSARYVRVRAYNIGKIPAWHPGAGGDPWIFVDEILIK